MSLATNPAPVQVEAEAPAERLHRFSLDDFDRMTQLGLLNEHDRVVLLDGLLVTKMTKGPRHTTATEKSRRALESVLPVGWLIRQEQPISLPGGPGGTDSAPEPDLAIVRGTLATYTDRHPGPAEVALVVEVAESSLAEDRKALLRLAWAKIPCTWIVNLIDNVVEVYTGPSGPSEFPGYATREVKGAGDFLTVLLDDAPRGPVAVADLLP